VKGKGNPLVRHFFFSESVFFFFFFRVYPRCMSRDK